MYTTNLLASDINVAMSYTSCCNIPECMCRNIQTYFGESLKP